MLEYHLNLLPLMRPVYYVRLMYFHFYFVKSEVLALLHLATTTDVE